MSILGVIEVVLTAENQQSQDFKFVHLVFAGLIFVALTDPAHPAHGLDRAAPGLGQLGRRSYDRPAGPARSATCARPTAATWCSTSSSLERGRALLHRADRRVRFGQVDAAALHRPARAVVDDGVVELDGEDITDPRIDGDRGAHPDRHRLPGLQPVPAPARDRQRDARRPARCTRCRGSRPRPRRWRCSTGSGLREQGHGPTGRALRRPAAAGGDRPGAGQQAAAHAVRRGDERPRPRTRRRGAGADPRAQGRRHDDAAGHPRDGLRPRRRRPGLLPRRRPGAARRGRRSRCWPTRSSRAPGSSCGGSSTPGGCDLEPPPTAGVFLPRGGKNGLPGSGGASRAYGRMSG